MSQETEEADMKTGLKLAAKATWGLAYTSWVCAPHILFRHLNEARHLQIT